MPCRYGARQLRLRPGEAQLTSAESGLSPRYDRLTEDAVAQRDRRAAARQRKPDASTTEAMICESWLPCQATGELPGRSVIRRAPGIAAA